MICIKLYNIMKRTIEVSIITLFLGGTVIPHNIYASLRIVTPTSPDYDQARVCMNKKYDLYPSMIFFCETAEDVKQAVTLARKAGKKVRIRSGRHSYEAFSNGNDIAVIDVSLIRHFRLSPD